MGSVRFVRSVLTVHTHTAGGWLAAPPHSHGSGLSGARSLCGSSRHPQQAGLPGTHHLLTLALPCPVPTPTTTCTCYLPSRDRPCFSGRALDSWNRLCLAALLDTEASNPMEYDFDFQLEIRGPCLLAGVRDAQPGWAQRSPRRERRRGAGGQGAHCPLPPTSSSKTNPSQDGFQGHHRSPHGVPRGNVHQGTVSLIKLSWRPHAMNGLVPRVEVPGSILGVEHSKAPQVVLMCSQGWEPRLR